MFIDIAIEKLQGLISFFTKIERFFLKNISLQKKLYLTWTWTNILYRSIKSKGKKQFDETLVIHMLIHSLLRTQL
jgi:hypothetical protein